MSTTAAMLVKEDTPERSERRSGRLSERLTQWLFLAPAIIYVVAFFGWPIVNNLIMSFQEYTVRTFVTGEAPWVWFENYISVFNSRIFGTTVLNTFLFTVGSIIGQFIIGLSLALFFRKRFPLSGVIRALLLLPWLIPMIAGTAVWRWILDRDGGVLNQVLSGIGAISGPVPWLTSTSVALISVVLVNIWLGIPFNLTLLYSGLQDIPEELYEAGSIDGANAWQQFWHITWPSLRPVVTVVLVLGVIYTLRVLDIILGLTGGGPANATMTLATYAYRNSFQLFQFGTGAAISNILIAVSLVFAFIYLGINRRPLDE